VRFRGAPPPAELLRAAPEPPTGALDPATLGQALGRLLVMAPAISLRHITVPRVSLAERLQHLRSLLRRGRSTFEEAVGDADRMTVAITVFALLELYKRGEAVWEQHESFGPIEVRALAASDRLAPDATLASAEAA
jgi:segregation and condensation protein A